MKDRQTEAENIARFKESRADKKALDDLVARLRDKVKEKFPAIIEQQGKEYAEEVVLNEATEYLRFGDFLLIRNKPMKVSRAYKLEGDISIIQGKKDVIYYYNLPVSVYYANGLENAEDALKKGWIIDPDKTDNYYYDSHIIRFVKEQEDGLHGTIGSDAYGRRNSSYIYESPGKPEQDIICFSKENVWKVPNGFGELALDKILGAIKVGYDEWYRTTI